MPGDQQRLRPYTSSLVAVVVLAGCATGTHARSDGGPDGSEPPVDSGQGDSGTTLPCQEVTFSYADRTAGSVWISGTFVGWASTPADGALVMARGADGVWTLTATLPLGRLVSPHLPRALHHAHRTKPGPLVGQWAQIEVPADHVVPRLDAPVLGIDGLQHRRALTLPHLRGRFRQMKRHFLFERRLVALERQHVVGTTITNLLRNRLLTARSVDRHEDSMKLEQLEQPRDRLDLAGLVLARHLARRHPVAAGPGAHHVQRAALCRFAERAPRRLAVDRDHLPFGQLRKRQRPLREATRQLLGVEHRKHPSQRVVRRDPVAKAREPAQPPQPRIAELLVRHPPIGTGRHRARRQHQDVDQAVAASAESPRGRQPLEMLRDRSSWCRRLGARAGISDRDQAKRGAPPARREEGGTFEVENRRVTPRAAMPRESGDGRGCCSRSRPWPPSCGGHPITTPIVRRSPRRNRSSSPRFRSTPPSRPQRAAPGADPGRRGTGAPGGSPQPARSVPTVR